MNHHFNLPIQAYTNETSSSVGFQACKCQNFYIGIIIINFKIEFLRTSNENVIFMKYPYDMYS